MHSPIFTIQVHSPKFLLIPQSFSAWTSKVLGYAYRETKSVQLVQHNSKQAAHRALCQWKVSHIPPVVNEENANISVSTFLLRVWMITSSIKQTITIVNTTEFHKTNIRGIFSWLEPDMKVTLLCGRQSHHFYSQEIRKTTYLQTI